MRYLAGSMKPSGHIIALPPDHAWPRPRWRFEFWLTVIPFVLAFLVWFWPPIASQISPLKLRLAIGIPLLLTPILAPMVAWFFSIARVAGRRIACYERLHTAALGQSHELSAIKEDVLQLAQRRTTAAVLDLLHATIRDGTFYIAVSKNPQVPISRDDTLVVVDRNDDLLMGVFRVVQERHMDYYAAATSGIDPLWKGQVHELGEVAMFPNMIALPIREGGSS